jgi:hypothetical protein
MYSPTPRLAPVAIATLPSSLFMMDPRELSAVSFQPPATDLVLHAHVAG